MISKEQKEQIVKDYGRTPGGRTKKRSSCIS